MQKFFITIQGATGCGKSRLAEMLAEEIGGEIISADSRQIYRYLDIGTAKPENAVRDKIRYHLVDFIDPDVAYNAGQFREDCLNKIEEITQRRKIPIIAGGTGFYISALINGLAKIPAISEETKQKVEAFIAGKTSQEIHAYLTEIDPVSAGRIETNDVQRQSRAIEVFIHTGRALSRFWNEQEAQCPYPHLDILVERDRQKLYERINQRVDKMIENGLIAEFLSAVQMGYTQNDHGMKSVGYRELFPWLYNSASLCDAVNKIKQHTRNYAKRQYTWYRKQDFNLTYDLGVVKFSFIKKNIETYLEKFKYDSSES